MKKLVFYLFAGMLLFYSCSNNNTNSISKTPVDYVNPYIGNISHLLVPCYPTIGRPNGMMRIYPIRSDFSASIMNGLPVAVTNHRGASGMSFNPTQVADSEIRPVMQYSYDLEKITPYSLSVYLDEAKINVDFAPAAQSAVYNFKFNKEGDAKLIITGRGSEVKMNPDGSVEGFRNERNNTRLYLYIESEQPVKSNSYVGDGKNSLVINFGNVKEVKIRYGISFIGSEQAKKNISREITGFETQPVALESKKIWNECLGKIKIEGGREQDKVVFYTSLYRTYERMINISEDGRYWSAYDGTVHEDEGTPFFVDDWIWDTYRATHPLRILIEPEKQKAMLNSYIRMSQQSPEKWLPTFPGVSGDSHGMNCNHGVAIFADALVKGVTGLDLETAFSAGYKAIHEKSLLPFTFQPAMELDRFFHENGYFPAIPDTEKETYKEVNPGEYRQPIPVTLGTSYDFWCLAQIAKALNKTDEYQYCMKRSLDYRNLFNNETGFFHPKDKDGNFIPDVDYGWSGDRENHSNYR